MACGTCSSSGGGCGCSSKPGGYTSCGDGCPSVNVYDWLPASTKQPQVDHYHYVEVAFKARRKAIYHNRSRLQVFSGDPVVVTAERGVDYGQVTMIGELVRLRRRSGESSGTIVRRATSKDDERHEHNRQDEDYALHEVKQSVERRRLPIKVVDVEWQFDRKRIAFYYVSEKKNVDLKKLIGELIFRYKRYRARVEMHRITPRSHAAQIGGIGVCGRELCCSSWMQSFRRITFNHAKKQMLPLNPDRLYGRCNQLKCCLNYELDHYVAALKEFPRKKARVQTAHGTGRVDTIDIFARTVLVIYDDDRSVNHVPVEDVEVLSGRKRPVPEPRA